MINPAGRFKKEFVVLGFFPASPPSSQVSAESGSYFQTTSYPQCFPTSADKYAPLADLGTKVTSFPGAINWDGTSASTAGGVWPPGE